MRETLRRHREIVARLITHALEHDLPHLGAPLPRAEQAKLERSLGPARRALTDTDGAAAWMEGWAMPVEKAIESALASETF